MDARWRRCRRWKGAQPACATGALPSHAPRDARIHPLVQQAPRGRPRDIPVADRGGTRDAVRHDDDGEHRRGGAGGGRDEDLRHGRGRGARSRRRHGRPARARVHRDHGRQRVRQVDAHAHLRGPRHRRRRRGAHRRPAAEGPEGQAAHAAAPRADRLRVPVVQPRAHAHRPREHPAAAGDRGSPPGAGVVRLGDRHRRPRRPAHPQAEPAQRRAAAAGRGRPRPGEPAAHRVRRRAHRQPRLPLRGRGARPAAPQRQRARPDRRHGDPRPGRGRRHRPRRLSRRRPRGRGPVASPTATPILETMARIAEHPL